MLHVKINNTRDDSYVKKGRNHDNLPYVRATGSIEHSLLPAKTPPPHTPVVSYLHLGANSVQIQPLIVNMVCLLTQAR